MNTVLIYCGHKEDVEKIASPTLKTIYVSLEDDIRGFQETYSLKTLIRCYISSFHSKLNTHFEKLNAHKVIIAGNLGDLNTRLATRAILTIFHPSKKVSGVFIMPECFIEGHDNYWLSYGFIRDNKHRFKKLYTVNKSKMDTNKKTSIREFYEMRKAFLLRRISELIK